MTLDQGQRKVIGYISLTYIPYIPYFQISKD